jgi:hypothetical protein
MSQATLDGSATPFVVPAGSIELANDGDALVLLGSIDMLGTISLNGTGSYTGVPTLADIAALMLASPTVTLGGGGTLLLANQFDSYVFGTSATPETLVNSNDTITGSGAIGVYGAGTLAPNITAEPIALINGAGGVIDANGTRSPACSSTRRSSTMACWRRPASADFTSTPAPSISLAAAPSWPAGRVSSSMPPPSSEECCKPPAAARFCSRRWTA